MAWPDNAELDPLFTGWDKKAFDAGSVLLGGWYMEFSGPVRPYPNYVSGTRRFKDPRLSPLTWIYPKIILRK